MISTLRGSSIIDVYCLAHFGDCCSLWEIVVRLLEVRCPRGKSVYLL